MIAIALRGYGADVPQGAGVIPARREGCGVRTRKRRRTAEWRRSRCGARSRDILGDLEYFGDDPTVLNLDQIDATVLNKVQNLV
ncbi:hypothetical protein ACIBEJ_51385 [Nonomuraea sp. NPDC050790]|uniref:hypothetical protein n=1 Tax=Nonomuraea sp. NPDC050790 TaxID=3364371 RepID=UPI00378F247F